ncbi:LOW QUALITY PROTEIN: vomeronasal type-1 receptor 4-like [Saimiri boliviensis]|uniref:LOW QUALITY PROTEIN: vomeronasal type-1 receptor 4-like n=1 Tax=Saimiri boliviensis TaxID=27679 RepID=UPI00193DB1E3|nr:LOW QUALITY PROTEIN: vomeronasal type-1 receptor 4-like [Saimiri boliviensis boliviensis]
MASGNVASGMIFLPQTVVGVLGNLSLLRSLSVYCTGGRLRSTDVIVQHLIVANILSLCKGVPQTMAAFGLRYFLNAVGCKLVFYLYGVDRGVSIGPTCLLSVFQVITISPRKPRWAKLKEKAPRHVGFSVLLCWLLYVLVNVIFPIYVTAKWNYTNIRGSKDLGYCSGRGHDKSTDTLHVMLLFPDVLCLGLMLWASSSVVCILRRHKQRVQHIRRTDLSPRASPETRATQSILFLMSNFVSSYTLSCLVQICITLSENPGRLLVDTAGFLNLCFPTLSPFVIMSCDPNVYRLCFAWKR